jgi:hypothetical protein
VREGEAHAVEVLTPRKQVEEKSKSKEKKKKT